MTPDDRQRRPFAIREYADRYCDGLLSAEQTAELERRLRDDPPALNEFILYMELHSRIAWNIRAGGVERRLPADSPAIDFPAGAAVDYPAVGAAVCPPCRTAADAAGPALPTIVLSDASPSAPFVGEFAFSYMVATVFMCLLLLGFWAYKLPSDRGSSIASNENSRGLTDPGDSFHARPAPVFVGRVTGMAGAKWSDEPNYIAPLGVRVALGRTYKLKSGLLEITYDSGAKVILEGPCDYKVDSTAGGYLALGKLVAKVGAGGEGRGAGKVASGQRPVVSVKDENGQRNAASLPTRHSPLATVSNPQSPIPNPLFAVRTPTAVVTDLGTEFGVEVTANGETTSHVFRGSVRMQIVGNDKHIVLHENESARIALDDSGKPSLAALGALHSPSFVLEMPASKSAAAAKAYGELVLSLEPAAYYRMEQPESKQDRFAVFDFAGEGRHGQLRLGNEYGGSPYRPGRFGDAISLRGPDVGDGLFVKDYTKARENRLTVVAWVMATGRPGWAMIAANWGHPTVKGQFHLGLYQRDGDLSVALNQSDGVQVDLREGPDEPLPLFVWQFVAFVADGDVFKLYRNGKLVASTACNGVYADPPISGLSVGCRMSDDETDAVAAPPGYHYWQGRIDELAIFTQALSDDQINQLFNGKQIKKEPNSAASRNGDEPMDGP